MISGSILCRLGTQYAHRGSILCRKQIVALHGTYCHNVIQYNLITLYLIVINISLCICINT